MKSLTRVGIAGAALLAYLSVGVAAQATPNVIAGTFTSDAGGFTTSATPGSTYTLKATAPTINAGTYDETLSISGLGSVAGLTSVTAPGGFAVQYQDALGNWTSTPPTTPVAVRAVGRVTSQGVMDPSTSQQTWSGVGTFSHAYVPDITLGIAGVGDGWDVSFDPGYTRVYNVYHHNNPSKLDCHLLTNGARCTGFPVNLGAKGLLTNSHPHAYVDTNGNVYVAGSEQAREGFQCVTAAAVDCGFDTVITNQSARDGLYDNFVGGFSLINGSLYGVDLLTGRLGCWSVATNAVCAGQPSNGWKVMNAAPGAGNVQIDGVGNYLWIMTADTFQLTCFDMTAQAKCAGTFPKTGVFDGLFAAPNNVANLACASGGSAQMYCFFADGTRTQAPAGLARAENILATNNFWNAVTTTDHVHYYWTYNGTFNANGIECYDASTGLSCPNFPISRAAMAAAPGGSSGMAYMAIPGPDSSHCLWTNSDAHELISWNLLTGTAGCPPGAATGTADYTFTANTPDLTRRLTCNGADNTSQWGALTIQSDTSNATSYSVNVLDNFNQPIPGWQNLSMVNVNGVPTLDLSTLSSSVTGLTPHFVITAHGFGAVGAVGVGLSKTSHTPELCVGVRALNVPCPTLASMQSGVPVSTTSSGTLSFDFSAVSASDSTIVDSAEQTASVGVVDTTKTLAACETNPKNPTVTAASDTVNGMSFALAAPSFTGGAPASDMSYTIYVDYRPWLSTTWTTATYAITPGIYSLNSFSSDYTKGGSYCVMFSSQNSHGSSFSVSLYSQLSAWTCLDHAVAPSTPTVSQLTAVRHKGTTTGSVSLNFAAPYNGEVTTYTVSLKVGTTVIVTNAASTGVGHAVVTVNSGLSGAVAAQVKACNSLGCVTSPWSSAVNPVFG